MTSYQHAVGGGWALAKKMNKGERQSHEPLLKKVENLLLCAWVFGFSRIERRLF
jgi:hypothetical protein